MKKKTEQFWVIDTERPGIDHGSHTAIGPFATQSAAESHLIRDCEDLLHATRFEDLNDMDPATYAAPAHIVKVVRTVRQTPQVRIAVKLVEVKVK
jgi:hypothetical protein